MCGIVGLFLKDKALEPQLGALLSDMLVTMTDRGPDSAGIAIYGGSANGRGKITVQSATPDVEFAGLGESLAAAGIEATVTVKSTHAVIEVDDVDAAMEHVRRHGSGHTEAIVTEDRAAARRWTTEVDAAAVLVNASTRFTDGGEFGFGAEIGISTQKLHARGPMALPELTTTKWVVEGDGQIRR